MNDKTGSAGPGLCLVTEMPDSVEALDRIATALDATAAVTLILTPRNGNTPPDADIARAIVKLAQDRGVAALIVDDAEAARDAEADGVHLTWRPDIEAAYGIARGVFGPRGIVGVEAGTSRHDAMSLGEAGADYVAFGPAPDDDGAPSAQQADLVAWWSDLFVVPSVGFGVETAAQAAELSEAGADFIAVRLPADLSADAISAWARSIVDAVHIASDAA